MSAMWRAFSPASLGRMSSIPDHSPLYLKILRDLGPVPVLLFSIEHLLYFSLERRRLVSDGCLEFFAHANQIRERIRLHFLHDVGAMKLNRPLHLMKLT